DEGIEAGARADIDDLLALGEAPQRKRIGDTGKGLDGDVRQRLDERLLVSQMLREVASGVKMMLAMRIGRDLAILVLDFLAQRRAVDGGFRLRVNTHRFLPSDYAFPTATGGLVKLLGAQEEAALSIQCTRTASRLSRP